MKFFRLLLLLAFTSCSIAPFHASNTGRTFGQGANQVEAGNVASNYYMKYMHGLSDNFDIGYFMEFGSYTTLGLDLKYSLINNPQGFATAIEFLYGSSEESEYKSIGSVNSYNLGNGFEFFFNARYNMIKTDSNNFTLNEASGKIKLKKFKLNYIYYAFGSNLWFTSSIGLSIYLSGITGSGIEDQSGVLGASLLLNF